MTVLRVPSPEEIRGWPVTVDVPTAGRAFGLGRDAAYDLARVGGFPVRVLRLGTRLRVTRAAILDALGIEDPPAGPSNSLARPPSWLVADAAGVTRTDAPPGGTA